MTNRPSYLNTVISHARNQAKDANAQSPFVTGIVVDVDDPQENSRVRAICVALGDDPNPLSMSLNDIPWARPLTGLGGVLDQGYRGTDTRVEGETSYGWFGTPKVGAEVAIAILDGDPSSRVYLGCIRQPGSMNTLPHGRYTSSGGRPDGPFTVDDQPLQPLYDSLTEAFGGKFGSKRDSYEWVSRGADYSVGAHRGAARSQNQTSDDPDVVSISEPDGSTREYTQGYGNDRIGDQSGVVVDPTRARDPQVYGLTTPGFHSLSMDDRAENCRIRVRTTTGHQIILDDTNERIYISSTKGKNWVEMDSNGNVDIHSDTRVSIHAAKDINLTSEQTIRLTSKDIHIRASNELRAFAAADAHLYSTASVRISAVSNIHMETNNVITAKAVGDIKLTTDASFHVATSASIHFTAQADIHSLASGNIINTGATIHSNSSVSASAASSAPGANTKTAYHTNRIPQHEPWPRILTDKSKSDDDALVASTPIDYASGTLSDFEFTSYDDPNIGRSDDGEAHNRNTLWHR